ncbi:MAG: DUF3575 domain-containing protein, partial [Rikenellaceae bacterium]
MKKVISILLMLLLCFPAYSQDASLTDSQTEQKSKQIEIYFDLNSYVVDSEYQNNNESLTNLTDLISWLKRDTLTTITGVEIKSFTSPDGDVVSNDRLSKRRANSVLEYVKNQISIPDSLISIENRGVAWDMLREMVVKSETPYKEEVIDVIDNVTIETWRRVKPTDRWQTLVDSRNKHLMDLRLGVPYRYMMRSIFPSLRRSSIVTIYFQREIEPIIEIIEQPLMVVEEVDKSVLEVEEVEEVAEPIAEPTITEPEPESISDSKSSLFALKTNLLYDAATIINVEAEIPIGDRWSVAGEWIFPWWTTSDNAYALQMLSGQLEGKYWFGNRTNKPQLTGWFAGLYAGGGLYDLQWDSNGYQGEFYIAAGISAGYAHTINKSGSLRMEYSVGV